MKKYIIFFAISLIAFSISFILLNSYKVSPSEINLEIEAIVPFDDVFQLFYQQEGSKGYAEKYSVRTKVIGSDKSQKINLKLPIDSQIIKIRLDISKNREQRTIEIKDVRLKSLQKSIKYNINNDFIPNAYIKLKDGLITTQVVNDHYDPYFTPKFDAKNAIESLMKEQPFFDRKIIILLSSIFSLTLFFLFYYENIQLKSIYSNLFIVIFIIILIAPSFSKIIKLDIEASLKEKRELSPKPEFELKKTYAQEYEKYYNDNFGLRTLFVNWNSKIKLDYFNVSPKPESAIFGKDGFLFYNSNIDGIYTSYSNRNVTDKQNLEKAYKKQLGLKNIFAKKKIKYIVGFFPNKHTIYKEKLPLSMTLQIQRETSLADQLVLYFKERNFPIIDVRDDLLSAKNQEQLYYKFDTHWNAYGAYIGYQSFCKQTFDKLNILPMDTSYFDIQRKEKRNGDLANMIGVKEITAYSDQSIIFKLKNKELGFKTISPKGYPKKTIITINENCDNKDTVLIFKDSFTTTLVPYFSLHFYKVIYISNAAIDMDLVEKNQPNIVMSLCVERALTHLLR